MAREIASCFAGYREAFLTITRRAKESFEKRDWTRLRTDSALRLGLYRGAIDRAESLTREILGERAHERLVWVSAKAVYSSLIAQRQDWELAETFFNGVTRRLFSTVGVDPMIEYVASDFDNPPSELREPIQRRYRGFTSMTELVTRVVADVPLDIPWADREGDAHLVAASIEAKLASMNASRALAVEMLRPLFFQGKGAYLVGRMLLPAGAVLPLVLAMRNGPAGVRVDAVLLDATDVSNLFSFTRSYFHVDVERPYDVMRFLRSLIPKKPIADIYIALGEPKQGKTELYRALMDHFEDNDERFCYAPGIHGLVMVVLTAPKLDLVLKVIRDNFPPQKDFSAARVRERYRWVYTHDRAGRLVDAQEFEHLAFPRSRFDPELLAELVSGCARSVRVEGERVWIEHAYIERRVTPLNIYVRTSPMPHALDALAEYARTIHDLALCNIFPGDLLLKNFGVTQHGRVALYDYDELAELTSVRFRDLPEATNVEDEMNAEPWFAVDPHDVFPEEFARFLGIPEVLRRALTETHPEIFRARWWRSIQERVRSGKIVEFPPYPPESRLRSPTERTPIESAG